MVSRGAGISAVPSGPSGGAGSRRSCSNAFVRRSAGGGRLADAPAPTADEPSPFAEELHGLRSASPRAVSRTSPWHSRSPSPLRQRVGRDSPIYPRGHEAPSDRGFDWPTRGRHQYGGPLQHHIGPSGGGALPGLIRAGEVGQRPAPDGVITAPRATAEPPEVIPPPPTPGRRRFHRSRRLGRQLGRVSGPSAGDRVAPTLSS